MKGDICGLSNWVQPGPEHLELRNLALVNIEALASGL